MVLILALLTFASSISYAAAPAVCNDLHALTCSETERKDPTGAGVTVFPDALAMQEMMRLSAKMTAEFKAKFDANENQELKQAIINALRPADQGVCTTSIASPECNRIASKALGDMYYIVEAHQEGDEDDQMFIAEGALAVIRREDYRAVAAKMTKEHVPSIDKQLVTKIEKELFPAAKAMLLKTVRELDLDEATKTKLVARISRTKFGGVNCSTDNGYNTGLLEKLQPNADYQERTGRIRVCSSQLRYSSSEFELIATIAHEMAHSIDPCSLDKVDVQPPATQATRLSDEVVGDQYLAKGFISCLRSPSSIEARKVPLKLGEEYSFAMANTLTRFCEKDQITESVADWFAAEVVAKFAESKALKAKPKFTKQQYVAGFSNIHRHNCEKMPALAEHPLTKDRINSIFLVQPKIRQLMGCPAKVPGKRYCDLNKPKSPVQLLRKMLSPSKSKQ